MRELAQYPHDVARAQRLLEEAGFPAGKDGVRLRLTMKTSTDETTRLMAAVLQQQLRAAGIALEMRSAEFGTFYADVTQGAFQMYVLRWIGSNEDPDIFRYMYASSSFPPKGGNRGRYSNARVDALLAEAAATSDRGRREERITSRCRRFLRRSCRVFRCGIRITRWFIRDGWRELCLVGPGASTFCGTRG